MEISSPVTSLITFSIVSHCQAGLVKNLLDDFELLNLANVEFIITINVEEDDSLYIREGLNYRLIKNKYPKGFGENHNFAFQQAKGNFFIIVNPDIRIKYMSIELLLQAMTDPQVGSVAPVIMNSKGGVEKSARFFPTLFNLLRKFFLRLNDSDYYWNKEPIKVDWTAGMFIVFRRVAYIDVGGFDSSRFFMYYEDVDICERLWKKGWSVVLDPRFTVVHDAQRASHRNIRHMRWHFTSALRYLVGL